MHRLFCLIALLLALPAVVAAQCQGEDLRDTLTPDERASIDAAVAAIPYPEGNRWRAERGGEVLHLVGTIHMSDPRLDAPMERLQPLIGDADMVLLEMTPTEKAELSRAMRDDPTLMMLDGATLPELLPEEDWQLLSEKLGKRGIPSFMAAKMQPWYLMMMLSIPPCAMNQLAEGNGLDSRIQAAALEAGTPMRALEPFDAALRLLGSEPLEEQLGYLETALATAEQDDDGLATTIAAYFDERFSEFQEMTPILMERTGLYTLEEARDLSDETTETILSRRNHAWIPVILQALDETEGPVVAAFGAAHLGGEDGVLNLLAEEGFTLTREAF